MLLKGLNGFPQLTQKRQSTCTYAQTQTEKETNNINDNNSDKNSNK